MQTGMQTGRLYANQKEQHPTTLWVDLCGGLQRIIDATHISIKHWSSKLFIKLTSVSREYCYPRAVHGRTSSQPPWLRIDSTLDIMFSDRCLRYIPHIQIR